MNMEKKLSVPKKKVSKSQTDTEYLNSSPEMIKRIKQAQEDINNGKGEKIVLDNLWK
jgi:hypothetical protein